MTRLVSAEEAKKIGARAQWAAMDFEYRAIVNESVPVLVATVQALYDRMGAMEEGGPSMKRAETESDLTLKGKARMTIRVSGKGVNGLCNSWKMGWRIVWSLLDSGVERVRIEGEM